MMSSRKTSLVIIQHHNLEQRWRLDNELVILIFGATLKLVLTQIFFAAKLKDVCEESTFYSL